MLIVYLPPGWDPCKVLGHLWEFLHCGEFVVCHRCLLVLSVWSL